MKVILILLLVLYFSIFITACQTQVTINLHVTLLTQENTDQQQFLIQVLFFTCIGIFL